MPWKIRNGVSYLYLSGHHNERCFSKYIGRGRIAQVVYTELTCRKLARQSSIRAVRTTRDRLVPADHFIESLRRAGSQLLETELRATEHILDYRHWRRKHNVRSLANSC